MDHIQNLQFPDESPILQNIGRYGYKLYDEADLILMYIHLLASALFPIWIGSHASLRRPPGGVCKDVKRLSSASGVLEVDDDDDDDELEEESSIEGLTPSDAIMFPILAGFTLAGLYFLIKWMDDPRLLNRILGWYFSCIGVFGIGKLAADTLNVATTFVFPSTWASGQDVYIVEPLLRQQMIVVETPFKAARGGPNHHKFLDNPTPLPGLSSCIKFPSPITKFLWTTRALLIEHWIFRAQLHGSGSFKSRVRLNDVTGFTIGVAAIAVYNFGGKPWWLTNLMGFGFCYGTLQLMSPTTFWTGSLVLMGLFIYDVVMVFYTPMMVSVATSLDVPIKLVFPGPKRGSMLGLGDVVLPGIMIALALRFDLYMFYLKKMRSSAMPASSTATDSKAASGSSVFLANKSYVEENRKPAYFSPTGLQGDRYWTAPSTLSLLPFPFTIFTSQSRQAGVPAEVLGGVFPKTYFYASIFGYITGMLVTLFVLNAYNHAQPALLYLVPGVLGSLWGTGLLRGEHKEMWHYTEDDGFFGGDDKSSKVEASKTTPEKMDLMSLEQLQALRAENETEEKLLATKIEAAKQKASSKKSKDQDHAHHIFVISLSKPRVGKKRKGVFVDGDGT